MRSSTCFFMGRQAQAEWTKPIGPVMNIARLVRCDELASDPDKCGTRGYPERAHSTPARSGEPRQDRCRRPCHHRRWPARIRNCQSFTISIYLAAATAKSTNTALLAHWLGLSPLAPRSCQSISAGWLRIATQWPCQSRPSGHGLRRSGHIKRNVGNI